MSLKGKRVLVTGATGFIGGRLVEKLVLEHGAIVRALVRDFRRAVRIGRFNVEYVQGEVTNSEIIEKATADCDVVFHCAFGNNGTPEEQRQVTVDGTNNVCTAAKNAGVSRLVYLSTLSVYGDLQSDTLTEEAPRTKTGDVYTDTKIDAEHRVVQMHQAHGLPTTILQPTAVYGPFGGWWTTGQINRLKNARFGLPSEGEGICNAVYVDDVVDACIEAAINERAIGETFLVSGPTPVTWNAFYEQIERMLGRDSIVHLTADDIRKRNIKPKQPKTFVGWGLQILRERPDVRQRIVNSWIGLPYRAASKLTPKRWLNKAKAGVLGSQYEGAPATPNSDASSESTNTIDDRPILVPDDASLPQFTATTNVSIDKLKERLGFQPRYDLDRGMKLTGQWAKWAGLLD